MHIVPSQFRSWNEVPQKDGQNRALSSTNFLAIFWTGVAPSCGFTAVIIVVRFIPHRIGLTFFRLVNAILGLILLGFAAFCGILLSSTSFARRVAFSEQLR
ncbi:MAG: hypothetical protein WB781_18390 [Candidatus Sulfotelmatobacter sp.]